MYDSTNDTFPGNRATSIQAHGRLSHLNSRANFPTKNTLRKELNFFNATALVINQIIGAGIFITASEVLQHTGSFGLTMVLWVVGALIAYFGSLCFLEMALLLKKSGGLYLFVKEAYSFGHSKPWMDTFGSMLAFMYIWSYVMIANPLGFAIVLLSMGRYVCRPFFLDCPEMPIYPVKLFGLFAMTFLVILNICSVKASSKLHYVISFTKTLGLFIVIVLGVWKLIQHGSFPEDSQHPFHGSKWNAASIALGLYGIIWTYNGWTIGITVQEETKTVRATIWMCLISVPIVAALYALTNVAFFAVLSYQDILDTEAVGLVFGHAALGRSGLVVFSLIGIALTFGAVHANIFESSRALFVASREGSFPRFFSGIHRTFKTPLLAILLQGILSSVFVLIGDIETLLNIYNANSWFWYGSAFLALIIMRLTMPHKPRPFKVILLLPSLMVVVSVLLIVLPLWQNPVPQLLGFASVLAGLPIYFIFVMEHPCRLRPRLLDRISSWLVSVTSKVFNTEIADQFSH